MRTSFVVSTVSGCLRSVGHSLSSSSRNRGSSMKLEKWALIADVIGSVAIVVTLVILITEVRTNTELSRVAAYDAVTRDFDDSRTLSLADPELLELFHQFTQGSLPVPRGAVSSSLLWLGSYWISSPRPSRSARSRQ